MREILSNANIAHNSRETGDEPRRFNPPDRVDGPMGIRSRHSYPSDHLQHRRRKPAKVETQHAASSP